MSQKCSACSDVVYPLERMTLGDQVFHKGCAKCAQCKSVLTISNFASAGERLLCKPHYMEQFKQAGGKYPTTISATNIASKSAAVQAPSTPFKPAVAESPRINEFLARTESMPPPPKPEPVLKVTSQLTNAEKLALFSASSIAQVEQTTPVKSSKPRPEMVAQAVFEPTVKPKDHPFQQDKRVEQVSSVEPSATASAFREKVALYKSTHLAAAPSSKEEDDGELETLRRRCAQLEDEVAALKARLELTEAGKEALVTQILALERRENVVQNQSPEAALEHAKTLLKQGKISKTQYSAAVQAAKESKQLLMADGEGKNWV